MILSEPNHIFKRSREIRAERKYYENLYEKETDRNKIRYLEKQIYNLLDQEEEEVIRALQIDYAKREKII